eukprot:1474473-Rhodomonas_salina.1
MLLLALGTRIPSVLLLGWRFFAVQSSLIYADRARLYTQTELAYTDRARFGPVHFVPHAITEVPYAASVLRARAGPVHFGPTWYAGPAHALRVRRSVHGVQPRQRHERGLPPFMHAALLFMAVVLPFMWAGVPCKAAEGNGGGEEENGGGRGNNGGDVGAAMAAVLTTMAVAAG